MVGMMWIVGLGIRCINQRARVFVAPSLGQGLHASEKPCGQEHLIFVKRTRERLRENENQYQKQHSKRFMPDRSSTSAPMGLDALPRHQPAHVVALQPARNAHEQSVLLRLLEIGLQPGEPVRVVAHGFPGRDPLAVRIGRTTFALRRPEAAMVQVLPLGAAQVAP